VPDDALSDQPCWACGAPPQMFRFECQECTQRFEDEEARQVRERLFKLPLLVVPLTD
jgi:hypothetical protein